MADFHDGRDLFSVLRADNTERLICIAVRIAAPRGARMGFEVGIGGRDVLFTNNVLNVYPGSLEGWRGGVMLEGWI